MSVGPNLFLIGAQKAGTTSLYSALGNHPAIFAPSVKEPNYFARHADLRGMVGPAGSASIARGSVLTERDYLSLFHLHRGQPIKLDGSTSYLWADSAAQEIATRYPDARILAVLRYPPDRALSAYRHLRREGLEPIPTFAAAVAASHRRDQDNWGLLWRYTQMGMYADQLHRYYSEFPSSQIKIIDYAGLRSYPAGTLVEIEKFLGLQTGLAHFPAVPRNTGGIPRSRLLHRASRSSTNHLSRRLAKYADPRMIDQLRSARDKLLEWNSKPEAVLGTDEGKRLVWESCRADAALLKPLLGPECPLWAGVVGHDPGTPHDT